MKWNFNIVRLLALEQMQIKNNQKYSHCSMKYIIHIIHHFLYYELW